MTAAKLHYFDTTCLFLLVLCSLVPASISAQSGNYTYVNIDYPNGMPSGPLGVNDSAQIVGSWQDTTTGALHGYFFDGTTYTTLDYPGAANTEAVGINNDGVISGFYYGVGSDLFPHGFIYSNGIFTSLTYPGTLNGTNGQGINNHNEVVGYWGYHDSFTYSDGTYTAFGYPGAYDTLGVGINDSGETSGYYYPTSSGYSYGFFDDGGTFTSIAYPGAFQTAAFGVNNLNVVVGDASLTSGLVGFLWQAGQFTLINPADWSPLPHGINNHGQIVGIYSPSGVRHGFLATPSSSPPLQFVPVTPCRLVDTRQTGGPIAGGSSRSFPVLQEGGCNIPASAAAYSLNVTAVPQGQLSYLTIWPTGENQPVVSTLNSLDGRIKADAAIVPAGTNGAVSVFVTNTTNVILDINGYFAPVSGSTLAFYPLPPCRVADTRDSTKPTGLGPPQLFSRTPRDFPVLNSTCIPSGVNAAAYSFNFTVVPGGHSVGYLSVWPTGQSQPVVSTLNDPTGTVVANAALVPAGSGGDVSVYSTDNTQLLIDINGYFAPAGTGGLSLYTLVPCRVIDTRHVGSGQPFSGTLSPPVDVVNSPCGVPATAQAYVFNATVLPTGGLGYLTLWPDGTLRPTVSTLNALDGSITNNMAIVPTTNGKVDAYASGLTQLILDISSYFAP